MLKLGAHNSIAGGLHNAVAECVAIGGDTLQVFCKNQRQWKAKPIEPEAAQAWKDAIAAAKVGPAMVHDSYLINLGTPDPTKAAGAHAAFLDEAERTEMLGIPYLNFHPGSHTHEVKASRDDRTVRDGCIDRIAAHVQTTIDEMPGAKVRFVIENAAGQGTNVGSSWTEVGRLMDAIGNPKRSGVTIDTQHAWASGYDWVNGYDEIWDEFDSQVGLKHLVAFHLNDSKMPCGSRADRHDTVGEGALGKEFFRTLINDRRFDGLVGFLETPEGLASWKREIAWLRSLRGAEEPVRMKPKGKAKAGQQRLG